MGVEGQSKGWLPQDNQSPWNWILLGNPVFESSHSRTLTWIWGFSAYKRGKVGPSHIVGIGNQSSDQIKEKVHFILILSSGVMIFILLLSTGHSRATAMLWSLHWWLALPSEQYWSAAQLFWSAAQVFWSLPSYFDELPNCFLPYFIKSSTMAKQTLSSDV